MYMVALICMIQELASDFIEILSLLGYNPDYNEYGLCRVNGAYALFASL